MIIRAIEKQLRAAAGQFPVVGVMGPRQSGKTTVVKAVFPEYTYISLEDTDIRELALRDPRGFLAAYANRVGIILDEIQEAPDLLSYLQGIVDADPRLGRFIVTGSQHFLLYEKISQTLAGRIAFITLLPLSSSELQQADLLPDTWSELLIKGGYPRLYNQTIDPRAWLLSYLSTYVEKDVRNTLRITDVAAFQRFLKLCAARNGTIINYADLARDADLSPHTAKGWLSILQASFIIYLLPPYHTNFSKRLIKSPKMYFYDTGLVCALLGIKTAEDLMLSPHKGPLCETFVVTEFLKYCYHMLEEPQLYFWRDTQGHEIDLLAEAAYGVATPIEVKASMTFNTDFCKGITVWHALTSHQEPKPKLTGAVLYGGLQDMTYHGIPIVSWRNITQLCEKIYGVSRVRAY